MKKCDGLQKYEELVYEVIAFCQKWGLWEDTAVLFNGKRYGYSPDENDKYKDLEKVAVLVGINPEDYTTGYTGGTWKCFDNPKHIFEMTFEGALYSVLYEQEFDVRIDQLTEAAKEFLKIKETEDYEDSYTEAEEYFEEECYTETRMGYDPAEFDSYEEYLELVEYCDPNYGDDRIPQAEIGNITSRDEYQDYLERMMQAKEMAILDWIGPDDFEEEDYEETYQLGKNKLAHKLFSDFYDLFEKYGLWFDFTFSWALTAYEKSAE